MDLFKDIVNIAAKQSVESAGFLLVDLIFRGNPGHRIIEIFMDGDKEISAKDCAEISRQIIKFIDDSGVSAPAFRLDVSSPGIDRPLIFLKQYIKNINRGFDLTYSENGVNKNVSANLIKVDGDDLVFRLKNKDEMTVNFNDIIKAKVSVSFR